MLQIYRLNLKYDNNKKYVAYNKHNMLQFNAFKYRLSIQNKH